MRYTKNLKVLFSKDLQLLSLCKSYETIKFFIVCFSVCLPIIFYNARNFVDATKLVVCHNKLLTWHKVFIGIAKRGKSSTGWFFGFKLHAVINQFGQLVVFRITSGNVADNDINLLESLTEKLEGFLYGDAGYLSSIAKKLQIRGLELITKVRNNMKQQELTPQQRHYLRHRGLD